MESVPNARGPATYMGFRQSLLMGIFWAGKLAGKEGKFSEMEGEHVALPTWTQGLVPTQRVREEASSHTVRVGIGPS